MANIMSLKNVRNKASRNGFDLSRRTCFTAKVGELLPVWWQYVLPGDSFTIDLSSFCRTIPVNTASFGRLREYYDFFFVPLDQLWNKSGTVLTQMLDNNQHATSLISRVKLSGNLPSISSLASINYYLISVHSSTYNLNLFGFDRAAASVKLLSYLGYGQADDTGLQMVTSKDNNPVLSLYPLLAYQKIYSDFFRFTQWESPNPSTFNVDWMTGVSDTVIEGANFTSGLRSNTMFDLRYCNYQKDLFHGIMPNAQFGETAAVPINGSGSAASLDLTKAKAVYGTADNIQGNVPVSDSTWTKSTDSSGNAYATVLSGQNITSQSFGFKWNSLSKPFDVVTDVKINGGSITSSSLSILALRQAEAFQRWKEVAQAAEEDYKQQIQAHWNVNVSDLLSGQCRYLGGNNGNININEVVNTNLVSGDSTQPADLAGKGIGSQRGKITFNSQGEYGVIMCVYHALPLLDYITSGTDAKLLHVQGSSFPIPEMDNIGMELIPSISLSNGVNWGSADSNAVDFLGYVPRYIDFKTDYDRCVGGFASARTGNLQTWIIPYADQEVRSITSSDDPQDLPDENPNAGLEGLQPTYYFTKVNPRVVDPMFAVSADDYVDTDPLLCQSFFDVKVTRNLDVNGLPY